MSVLAINDFYRGVVESLGFAVRGGRVIFIADDGEEDILVADKMLVLPDDRFLKRPDWETETPFHPLCENPHRGESEVVKLVLETAVANLNITMLGLVTHLFANVVCIKDTKVLTTEQSEILTYVSNGGDKTKAAIVGMIGWIKKKNEADSLISCNLRRRCPLGDKKFERVCVVRFPFAEMTKKDEPYGLKTNAEIDALRGLFDFIVPGWQNEDTYSVGTNTFTAPYFTSIIMMYGALGIRFNEVIDQYKDICPDLEKYRIVGIESVMEKLNTEGYMKSLSESIPALGDSNKGSLNVSRTPATNYEVTQPAQQVTNLPFDTNPQQTQQPSGVQPEVEPGVATYIPGSVNPTVQNSMQSMLLTALASTMGAQAGNLGGMLPGLTQQPVANIDLNTFHGRQLAKQALATPLSNQQAVLNNAFGGSPYLDSGATKDASVYVPGSISGRRPVEQSQSIYRHQQVNNQLPF